MAEQSYSHNAGYITASMDISGANNVTQIFARPFKLMEIRVFTSILTATADETMTVTRRPIPNTTTSAVTIGTFIVPSTLAAGDEVRYSLAANAIGTEFNSGEEIRIICGNSTGTGTVYFGLLGYHFPSGPTAQASFSAATKAIASGVGSIKYGAFTSA